ncbi:hypothetical protein E2C01_050224 [Portunus trituberculatus]|uniref:Uncharacterized protein n=1 Tax=Portunus trituberculatus TaxID=210409 RepID=A0A5B7G8E9_PORTR|nr:hypothetical protein [Portunus trituberculatus]
MSIYVSARRRFQTQRRRNTGHLLGEVIWYRLRLRESTSSPTEKLPGAKTEIPTVRPQAQRSVRATRPPRYFKEYSKCPASVEHSKAGVSLQRQDNRSTFTLLQSAA